MKKRLSMQLNFSHTFKKNFKGISFYGNKKNLICTNEHGFKNKAICYNISRIIMIIFL